MKYWNFAIWTAYWRVPPLLMFRKCGYCLRLPKLRSVSRKPWLTKEPHKFLTLHRFMSSVTWSATGHLSPRQTGDPCLSHRRQGGDRQISGNKLCLHLNFFGVISVSPVTHKNLVLFLTQERSRKINAKFLQKEDLNKNSTSMTGLDDLKGLCQPWWFYDSDSEGDTSLLKVKGFCQSAKWNISGRAYCQVAESQTKPKQLWFLTAQALKAHFWKLIYLVLELIIVHTCCESWISRAFRK